MEVVILSNDSTVDARRVFMGCQHREIELNKSCKQHLLFHNAFY